MKRSLLRPLRAAAALCLLVPACRSSGGGATSDTSPTSPAEPGAASGGPGGAPGSAGGGAAGADGGGGDAAAAGDDGQPPPRPYVDYDVNHVLFAGQSNSIALGAVPPLTTTQPYQNIMFDTGVMPMSDCDGEGCRHYDAPSAFVPLVEGDRFFYPTETAASSIANEITFLAKGPYAAQVPALGGKHDVLVTLHGRSGNTYWCLRKNGCDYKPGYLKAFDQAMMEVQSAIALAKAQHRSYVVRAVAVIHGESDHYAYSSGNVEFPLDGTNGEPKAIKDYADALIEWQRDYEEAVRAFTGQAEPVPLFVSQISGWNDTRTSKIAQYQLEAHERAPGKVVLIGPFYHTSPADDCRHFDNVGVQYVGEQFAKVYARVVFEGKRWEPLRPRTVTRSGAVITARFHVPAPPLVIDTERVAEAPAYGFDFTDGSASPPKIQKVELTGPDTVTITLSGEPTGPDRHLTYAQNQTPNTCIQNPEGARGNLRDSDTTPSQHGLPLFNWTVHFDVAVP